MQSRVKLLSSTALAMAAIVMAVPMASAQDIGALEKRVKALEKSSGGQNVSRSKKTMKLTVNGHINRAIQYRNNGTKSGILNVTPNMSRSRVRWLGSGKVSDDLSVNTKIEFGNQSSISTSQDLGDNGDDNGGGLALDTRIIELYITSKTLGRIYLGQGYTAASNSYASDLSGTGLLSLNGFNELLAGSEVFQNPAIGGNSTGITVGSVFNNLDSPRRSRVRYDTPKFSGFQLRAALLNSDAWDVGLYYGGSLGGVKVRASVGYNDSKTLPGTSSNSTLVGSASVLLPMGLSFTVAGGARDNSTSGSVQDKTNWRYGKIGYKFKSLELGQTRLFVDYGRHDDVRAIGDEATSWGVGVVQIVEPLGMEVYLGYNNFDVDLAANAPSDSIDVITFGVRAAF